MGSSFSGILTYGIPVDSEELSKWDGDDFELSQRWEEEHRPPQPENSDYRSPAWNEWRAKWDEWRATPDNVRMEWCGWLEDARGGVIHCCCCELESEWGEFVPLDMAKMNADMSEYDAKIREFCEFAKFPYKQPVWLLTSKQG